MNKVEDNSKISININLNLEKKIHPPQLATQVMGRKLDNSTTITVNPMHRAQSYNQAASKKPKNKVSIEASTDIQADFSNISYQKENDRTINQSLNLQDKLKKLLHKTNKSKGLDANSSVLQQVNQNARSSMTYTHNQSLNQTSSIIKHNMSNHENKSHYENKSHHIENKKQRSKSKTRRAKKSSRQKSPKRQDQIIKKPLESMTARTDPQKVQQLIQMNLKKKKQEEDKDKSMMLLMEKEKEVKRRELEVKNQEIRQQNGQRFARRRADMDQNVHIPWGLNQERLKGYLLQQVLQHNNYLLQQQMRTYKQGKDPKERRDQIGLSFLNNYDESTVDQLKVQQREQKQRDQTVELTDNAHLHHVFEGPEQEEIRQYQDWKNRVTQLQEEERRQEQVFKVVKIQQNLRNLDEHIKQTRSRSQSDYIMQVVKRRDEEVPLKPTEQSLLRPVMEMKRLKKKKKRTSPQKKLKQQQKRELVMQFRNLTERYNLIHQERESTLVKGSLIGLISSSGDDVGGSPDISQRLDELDTSFFSDRQYFPTNQDERSIQPAHKSNHTVEGMLDGTQSAQLVHEFNEEEEMEMAGIRSIERQMKNQPNLNKQATMIQKYWRGYKTRQILRLYLQQAEENELEGDQFDLNNLSESQIEELVKLGYLQVDQDGNIHVEQEQSEHSAQYAQEISDSSKGLTGNLPQAMDTEAYNNYMHDQEEWDRQQKTDSKSLLTIKELEQLSAIKVNNTTTDPSMEITRKQQEDLARMLEEQKEKWQEMLNYVAGLQRKGSQVDISEVLRNIKNMSELNQRLADNNEVNNFNNNQNNNFNNNNNTNSNNKIKRKRRLQLSIDVDKIEEEYNGQQDDDDQHHQHETPIQHQSRDYTVSASSKNQLKNTSDIDLSEMRLALGSESLVRDHSRSSEGAPLNDSSIFEQNPFKDFTSRRFRELLKRENMDQLVALREQALEERRRSQGKRIKEMLHQNRISPKTFNREWLKLEKWVTKEREELMERKGEMETGWRGTYDTVLKTQRDLMFMQKNKQDGSTYTILANSFSHEHIPQKMLLSNKDSSEVHIKIIDNYHSDTQVQQQHSQLLSCSPRRMQNQALHKKYINYEHQLQELPSEQKQQQQDDLCKSEMLGASRNREEDQSSQMFIQSSPFLQSSQQTVMNVPNSSPTPSPKYHARMQSPDDLKDWEDDILADLRPSDLDISRMGQSQMIKISSIVTQVDAQVRQFINNYAYDSRSFLDQRITVSETQEELKDKKINNYTTLITSLLIAQEVQNLHQEMQIVGIDLIDLINRNSFSAQITNQNKSSDKRSQRTTQKGIKTNLTQVKQYLTKLSEYIQNEYVSELVQQINVPLGPSSKEMLKYLHFNEQNSQCSQIESSTDSTYQHSAILNTELFAGMESFLEQQSFIKQSHEFLLELEHIHNKVVFDAVNEALDQYRPYGLKGQPFPWKVDSTKLVPRQIKASEVKSLMKKSEDKVIEWAQCLVGIIIDKEDSPFPKMLMFDTDYLNQIKEDRLLRMLQAEIIEQEERWINYDEEQTEIEVEMADIVFDHLICEFISEIYKSGAPPNP